MNSIGTINTSYIVEYDENSENDQNLDNKFIVKVKSSNLNDVIILFKEPNFERFIHEAFNCFIVCVEFESNEEEEDDDDEYTAMRLAETFKADRLIILELNQNLWIKKCFQKIFSNLKSPIMRMYHQLLEDINYEGNFLNTHLELLHSKYHIGPGTEDFVIKIIKLFKFKNQKEVDEELFEMAIKQKCSFEVIQSMIDFHKDSSNGISKHAVNALFLAKGMKVFDEETIQNYKQKLTKKEKEKITDEIGKFHSNKDSLLLHVCSRSRIALIVEVKEDEQLQKIKEFYKDLIDLNLDSVSNLLKIVDHKLLIIFDFDSDSIERSYLMGSRYNRGIFDQDRMRIYIGAKNSNNPSSQEYINRHWEIIGILIHEICHYVNFKVFNNNCKPYQKDDANIQEYERIVNEYKSWIDHHEIVGRVFSNYEETMWHAEMIVRVVQMIVTYKVLNSKHLKSLEEKYQSLFSYFNNTVMPQIKEYLDPDNQIKRQIKEVSSFRLNQFEIKPVKQIINFDEEKYIHFMESNSLKLAMAMFCLNFADDFAIFTTFTDLMDEFKGNEVLQLWSSDWRIKIVIFCDQINESSKFDECIKKLDNSDRLNQIFIIFEEQSQNIKKLKLKFTKKIENLENMNFNFTSLTEESKDLILQRDVIFQGNQTTLNKIITKDSKAAQFLPINHLLESSDPIVIGRLPEKNTDYDDKMFIERKLTHKIKNQVKEFSTENMDDIVKLLSTKKYIIISDEVGKGKSTLMTYLAYRFLKSALPHIEGKFFVVKVNLYLYANILREFERNFNLVEFVFDNFVKSSDFKEFERKVFEEYFEKEKVILMLDGLDEVLPTCETQTLRIIQDAFRFDSLKVIIATRPFVLNKLETSKTVVLSLSPIQSSDQQNFLTKYFKSQNQIAKRFSKSEFDELIKIMMHKLFSAVRENSDDYKNEKILLSSPLHLKMFAEVICKKILNSKCKFEDAISSITFLNMYKMFDEFFQNKLAIALEHKGKVVKDEIRNLELKGHRRPDFYNSGRKLAWNTLHPSYRENPIEINEKEKDLLQYYGVVSKQNNEIHFIHRSYAEFFIAHLFIAILIEGNCSSLSNFAKENFLVSILTGYDLETIKEFIDTALSDKNLYDEISNDSFECLGKFIINEFKTLEGNDKNFLHCAFFHELNHGLHRIPRKDYVFVSHLMVQSLIYCNDQEDVDVIKNILQLPWDINNIPEHLKSPDYKYLYTMETGKNLFHLTCELGINSLLLVVWDLALKVFQEDAKEFFFTKSSTSPYDFNYDAVYFAFRRIERNEGKFTLQQCLNIDEMRLFKNVNIFKKINLNEADNFQSSSLYLLFEIMKNLRLSDEEVYEIYLSNIELIYKYEFLLLNLNFLKEKLTENNYQLSFEIIFAICLQSKNRWPFINDLKASILYSELKNIYSDLEKLKEFFNIRPHFFDLFFEDESNEQAFNICLQTYFNILDEDHLTMLLLNKSNDNKNIINKIFSSVENKWIAIGRKQLILNLLESKYTDKEKLFTIFEQSQILEVCRLSEENFSLVNAFCEKHFEKSKIQALLFSPENRV
ncbi:unnamed protein product [Chironomus riparius]|uniref:NACHT domain-containing protein n=1 Tax=Chironomus riparius TaxID=315576 RepID=A0A9N9S235_9DIPT|nr:unnamed protein product [Chironomus riparius]